MAKVVKSRAESGAELMENRSSTYSRSEGKTDPQQKVEPKPRRKKNRVGREKRFRVAGGGRGWARGVVSAGGTRRVYRSRWVAGGWEVWGGGVCGRRGGGGVGSAAGFSGWMVCAGRYRQREGNRNSGGGVLWEEGFRGVDRDRGMRGSVSRLLYDSVDGVGPMAAVTGRPQC